MTAEKMATKVAEELASFAELAVKKLEEQRDAIIDLQNYVKQLEARIEKLEKLTNKEQA